MNGSTSGDLSAVLAALRRRVGLIALVLVLTVAAAYVFVARQPEQYEARSTLLFRVSDVASQVLGAAPPGVPDPERQGQTNVQLVSLDVVKRRTAAKLGSETLPATIVAAPEGQSDLVSVTAEAESPDLAARVANTFAAEFVAFRRENARDQLEQAENRARDQLRRLAGTSGSRLRQLRDNIQSLQLAQSVQTGDVELVQRAVPPAEASSPKVGSVLLIAGAVGLLLGLVVALVVDQLDRRVRKAGELSRLIGVPMLAAVPRSAALRGRRRRGEGASDGGHGELERLSGDEAEAFRRLHANLRHSDFGRDVRSVAVTSPSAHTGKTTVALQLAATASDAGLRVLLVEGDTRRPDLAAVLKLDGEADGLTAFLRDPTSLDGRIQSVALDDGDTAFDVVLAGGSLRNPSQLFDSNQMADLLSVTRHGYDFVVIDLPPFDAPEVVPVIKYVDGVLIVSRVGDDSRSFQRIKAELQRLGVEPLGVVANFSKHEEGVAAYEAAHAAG